MILLETIFSYTITSLAETPDDLFELTLGGDDNVYHE